ncbi:anthranilate synthase component II [Methanosalsum natronophilum]|uniref:anthranilate synthase component II n=1 Tax=Methanosalsum natronophilum TaxID=768733 RepID=UPI002168E561|nr:aminodeoxychorismate/anthranilate synthase component II [Methanosalsum natronophilum]MCS3924241.1 anthranilate synthase component 2 [Methanosalsum natronophilum]
MKTLFINNRDSFVWNLVDYFSINGSETQVVPNNISLKSIKKIDPDSIVISPGPGNPDNFKDIGNCINIISYFKDMIPILGVCLGHQAINTAFGGETGRSMSGPVHGKECEIYHNRSSLFQDIPDPFLSARYHSLAIVKLGDNLEVTAKSNDGIIMGISHEQLPIYGVQFHPESILTQEGKNIIKNFLSIVK